MQLITSLIIAALVASQAAASPLAARDVSDAEIARLAPDLGVTPGIKFGDGSADCAGITDPTDPSKKKRIPCDCPPGRDEFIKALQANVHAGHAVNNTVTLITFPTDDSKDSKLGRIQASISTLQNLRGTGKGCPFVSTNFGAQQNAINAGQDLPSSGGGAANDAPAPSSSDSPASSTSSGAAASSTASSAPSSTDAPAPPASTGAPSDAQIASLAPTLGWRNGINPRHGDCDGAVNGTDKAPIAVPCRCPPARADFLAKLTANIRAGHVVTNPSVLIAFPTDDSDAAKLARINAASSTLQGDGCPVVSSTLQAQDAAIRKGTAPPPDLSDAPASSGGADAPAPSTPPSGTDSPSSGADQPANGTFPSDPAQFTFAQVDSLMPDLGFSKGQNPDGSGSCDGATPGVKIPCACPPDRPDFIAHALANVHANRVVNNTDVPWAFPTGTSLRDQLTRIDAATTTLQNLVSAGHGCPNAGTTLNKQRDALNAQLAAQGQ